MGIKISALPAASGADSAMQFEVNNAGTSQRLTLAQMFALSMAAVTVDTPLLNMAQTWNAGGVTFTGWKLNITDTASAAASKLLDLQVAGSSLLAVGKNGRLQGAVDSNTFSFNTVQVQGSLRTVGLAVIGDGGNLASIVLNSMNTNAGVVLGNGLPLSFSPASSVNAGTVVTAVDLLLFREAAGTLAQRNSTFAQEFRLYGTYSDASNYERGFFRFSTGAGAYEFGSEKAGTGGARNVRFFRDGTEHILLNGSVQLGRNLIFATDNTYDLGASGATRPRTGYFATSLFVGANQVLSTRATGWGAPTGTPTRTTFATGSVTLPLLAERVKALIDDLTTHGLIGA